MKLRLAWRPLRFRIPSITRKGELRLAESSGGAALWRVLVVEDEYYLADDLRRELEGAGAVILGPVSTVARALAALDGDETPDVAVLDINLRDETVWPVAEALEARGIGFVFATGYGEDILPTRFRNVPFFRKPVDFKALIAARRRSGGHAQE